MSGETQHWNKALFAWKMRFTLFCSELNLGLFLHVVQIDFLFPVFSDAGHIIVLCWRKGAFVLHFV